MKIYLDDERPTPEGWIHCRWPSCVIAWLKTGKVTEISLDHDLGDDSIGTGYDVLLWLEEQVYHKKMVAPKINIHTANSSARDKMNRAAKQIEMYNKF